LITKPKAELTDAIAAMKARGLGVAEGPQWCDEPTAEGWHWCEVLERDAPPQLLRERMPLSWDGGQWERWTVGGWVPLFGRVASCTGRPE
jgi:hypothetical protein